MDKIKRLIKLLLFVFLINSNLFALENGKPIPVERYGAIGSGGLDNYPVGFVKIDNKDMLFTYTTGYTMNKNNLNLFEKMGETDDKAPLFKFVKAINTSSIEMTMYSKIFRSIDGNIYGFFKTKKGLQRTKFDEQKYEFVPFGNKLNIQNPVGIVEMPNGNIYIYQAGKTTIVPSEKEHIRQWKLNATYYPFDGSMIWRKGEFRAFLTVSKLNSITDDKLSKPILATKTKTETLTYTAGSFYTDKNATTHFFVGTREGIIAYYIVANDGKLSQLKLCKVDDIALRSPMVNTTALVYISNEKPNIFIGGQGCIYSYKFKYFDSNKIPTYEDAKRTRQTNTNIYFGSLPMIDAVDWNSDGLLDIVVGNSQGQIALVKNIGELGKPKFTEPEVFKKEGVDFIEKGGYYNVQGPWEAQWGYVAPTAFDWNDDGNYDLLTGDNTSHFGVYFNKGTNENPNFTERKMLYCNGLEVHGTWRQRPAIAKLNNGKVAYVMLDWDDQIHLYWKLDKLNLIDGGKLLLIDGKPITATGTRNGETGRVKMSLVDIDNDGKTDLLLGTIAKNSIPELTRGIPRNLKKRGASVLWLRNVGNDDNPVFEYPRYMKLKEKYEIKESRITSFGWHSCSADVADFGNGLKGILVGMENGNITLYKPEDFDWIDYEDVVRNPQSSPKKQ